MQQAQQELLQFQLQHPAMQHHNTEEEIMRRFKAAEKKHDLYWHQRSRTQWNQHGDRYTVFLHAIAS
jgi:hypothetical protein